MDALAKSALSATEIYIISLKQPWHWAYHTQKENQY
jgi:hypothetical protein